MCPCCREESPLGFPGVLTAVASTPSALGFPNLWVYNFLSEILSLISSALQCFLYFLYRSWLFVEESSQRPLQTSFSCTSQEVKANWGVGFAVLRGIPWHTSCPVQTVLGIRVPWTLTVELLSPVFLLLPQSLLTDEIMDGTRFWGLA